MNIIDILGWIGNIGFILGAYLIARKNTLGLYAFGMANLIYIIVGLMTQITCLWAISIYLLSMNIYGIINWQKNNKDKIVK